MVLHIYFARDLCTWCFMYEKSPKALVHHEETECKKVCLLRTAKHKIIHQSVLPPKLPNAAPSVYQIPKRRFTNERSIFSLHSPSRQRNPQCVFIESGNWLGPKVCLFLPLWPRLRTFCLSQRLRKAHVMLLSGCQIMSAFHFHLRQNEVKGNINENKILRCEEGCGLNQDFDASIYLIQRTKI